jgi:hypothetical protein
MIPGQQPQRISQPIENLLLNIDTGANGIRLIWDDRFQGFHIFVTPFAGPGAVGSTHFFWEQRTGAWWEDQFASPNFDPLCCCALDGNTPGDRVPLIGSWDGYVRAVDPSATTDDGLPILSQVLIGPFLTPNMDDVLLKDLQAILGVNSGAVTYSVYVGQTAEQALTSTAAVTGTWQAARNYTDFVRKSGHAVYIGINANNPWAIESIRIRIALQGKVRMRNKI